MIRLLLLSLLLLNPVLAAEKPLIKIGFVGPFTGAFGYVGEGARDAVAMAREKLPSTTKYRYEVVYEDNQMQSEKTALALSRLIEVEKVDALVSVWSMTGFVVNPVAEKKHILHIGLCWSSDVAKGDYNFDLYAPPWEMARAFLAEMQRRGLHSLAMFYRKDSGSSEIARELRRLGPSFGIRITGEDTFNFDDHDFRSALAKLAAVKPDLFWLHADSPQLELLVKQYRESLPAIPFAGIEGFGTAQDPSVLKGSWYAASDLPEKFRADYEKQFRRVMFFQVPYFYDLFNLIVTAFENSPAAPGSKPTSAQAAATLNKMKSFTGVCGDLKPTPDGYFQAKATIKEIPITLERK